MSLAIEIYRALHTSSGSVHRACTHAASFAHMKSAHIDSRVMSTARAGFILPRHEQLHAMLSWQERSQAKVSPHDASPCGASPLQELPSTQRAHASQLLVPTAWRQWTERGSARQ
jgi:hypothetical protein